MISSPDTTGLADKESIVAFIFFKLSSNNRGSVGSAWTSAAAAAAAAAVAGLVHGWAGLAGGTRPVGGSRVGVVVTPGPAVAAATTGAGAAEVVLMVAVLRTTLPLAWCSTGCCELGLVVVCVERTRVEGTPDTTVLVDVGGTGGKLGCFILPSTGVPG